ncbi:unnamed protein product [Heterobilharzia americana]|nr:unnamed protein product [Heterobilharzia americana]
MSISEPLLISYNNSTPVTMISDEQNKSTTDLATQPPGKRISKARKSGSAGHQSNNEVKTSNTDDMNTCVINSTVDNRELDRLKFTNPGRQMEGLKVSWSEANLTRSVRRQLSVKPIRKASDRLPPLYDSRGRFLETLEDVCDCLKPKCPGCHLPCRRCHSMLCGATCRIYRTFRVQEVNLFI